MTRQPSIPMPGGPIPSGTPANAPAHRVSERLWQNGTVTDLGVIGNIGTLSNLEAMSMNNNGQIVGWTAVGTTGFLYSNGTITDLSGFFPNAINDNGVMVGGSLIDRGGTVQDLNSLIPAKSGYQITYATAITDNGQIVANASDATTSQAAVLLNPS